LCWEGGGVERKKRFFPLHKKVLDVGGTQEFGGSSLGLRSTVERKKKKREKNVRSSRGKMLGLQKKKKEAPRERLVTVDR